MELGHTIAESREKYPEITDDILMELREWAQNSGLSQIPDEQLALFVHSCYFNVDDAKRCMIVYYKIRATVPEFFGNRDPRADYLQRSLRALQFVGLPKPDKNGNRVIFHRLADTRPSQYHFNDGIKLLQMSVDASLFTYGCAPGYVFLFDMQGVSLGHLTRLSIPSIHRFFEYLQNGLPVRIQGIHILNVVWFMNKILTLIKPFMSRELFEMLHLYSGDVSEVYEYISPECLPKDFGGELDSVDILHEEHCRKLDNLRDYFLAEERLFRSWSSLRKKSLSPVNNNENEIVKNKINEM